MEKATVTIAAATPDTELRPLIKHLCATGQLTAGLILRALLSGNMALFEEALAELTDLPVARVAGLVGDRQRRLRALFAKAQLPPSTFPAFKEAMKAMRAGFSDEAGGAARLKRRMIERVLTRCEDADLGELAPLLTLLRRFATEAAREEARLFCDDLVAWNGPGAFGRGITFSAHPVSLPVLPHAAGYAVPRQLSADGEGVSWRAGGSRGFGGGAIVRMRFCGVVGLALHQPDIPRSRRRNFYSQHSPSTPAMLG